MFMSVWTPTSRLSKREAGSPLTPSSSFMVLASNQVQMRKPNGRFDWQFTTDGVVNLTMNFQWDDEASATFNNEGISIVFPEVPVPGCTNPAADNYNPVANEDDGSCTYGGGICTGCLTTLFLQTRSVREEHLPHLRQFFYTRR